MWAIPLAFSEAIANCSFCRGDTFYDTLKGYLPWDEAIKHVRYDIQIIDSPKDSSLVDFKTNWCRTVKLSLTDYKNNLTKQYYDTTQGRLFTLLWKGSLSILDKNIPEPQPPLLLQELKTLLHNITNKIKKDDSKIIFVMPYDPLNEIAIEKDSKIKTLLKLNFKVDISDISPRDIIPECKVFPFTPTITYRCYKIESLDLNKTNAVLKTALYKPQKDSKAHLFNINRHGVLLY